MALPVISARHAHALALPCPCPARTFTLDLPYFRLSEYTGHKNDDYKLDSALSHNDAYVVSGSEDGDVCIWDLVSGDTIFRRKAHASVVASIAYHPKKPLMISASVDGVVKVWSNKPAPDPDDD